MARRGLRACALRFAAALVCGVASSAAIGRVDEPTPSSLLRAADQALGWSAGVRCRVVVEPIGSTALDQSRLDVEVRATPSGEAWRFWIKGEATLPDGVTTREIAITTDPDLTRVLDMERQRVMEAEGATGVTLLNEASVLPAVFWLASWDVMVSQQTIDGGDGLPMRYAGVRAVDGRACDAVHVDYTRIKPQLGTLRDVWWFFDRQTHLPLRIEACHFRRDQNAYGYNVLTITGLDSEASFADGEMELATPAGFTTETYELPVGDDVAMGGPAVGQRAPEWTLRDAAGQTRSLKDYRDRIVVLDFWATWCGPCVAAMPKLQALHEEFLDEPVNIIGMNMAESADPIAYMASKGFTYGLLLEADDVAGEYGVDGIPSLWVIGPDGKVLFRQTGMSPSLERDLRKVIERALDAMPPEMRRGAAEHEEADEGEDATEASPDGPSNGGR